jgi:hypothetical protein
VDRQGAEDVSTITPLTATGSGYSLRELLGLYQRRVVSYGCFTLLPKHLGYKDAVESKQDAKDIQGTHGADHAVYA